jgi:hypothetical protein
MRAKHLSALVGATLFAWAAGSLGQTSYDQGESKRCNTMTGAQKEQCLRDAKAIDAGREIRPLPALRHHDRRREGAVPPGRSAQGPKHSDDERQRLMPVPVMQVRVMRVPMP